MRISPLAGSLAAFLFGIMILAILLVPDVLNSDDVDDDGISDTFQDVTEVSDLIMTPSGEWKEVSIGHTSTMDIPFTLFTSSFFLFGLPISVYYLIWEIPRKKQNISRKAEAAALHILVFCRRCWFQPLLFLHPPRVGGKGAEVCQIWAVYDRL